MGTNSKTSKIGSLLKGVSWRIIATLDTFLVVLLVTCLADNCSHEDALKIGASEFLIKLIIYYVHERVWLTVLNKPAVTYKEILFKTVSWRLIATLTTFVISGIVLGSFTEIAIYIAIIELVTKLLLYYGHEKLWLYLCGEQIRNYFTQIRK